MVDRDFFIKMIKSLSKTLKNQWIKEIEGYQNELYKCYIKRQATITWESKQWVGQMAHHFRILPALPEYNSLITASTQ